jgi:hypothetical protein
MGREEMCAVIQHETVQEGTGRFREEGKNAKRLKND